MLLQVGGWQEGACLVKSIAEAAGELIHRAFDAGRSERHRALYGGDPLRIRERLRVITCSSLRSDVVEISRKKPGARSGRERV
jgi:hypothetical protein